MTDLDLIRDPNVSVSALAAHFGESEEFVGGLLDSVLGDDTWRDLFDADTRPTQAEVDDFERGFALGHSLVTEDDLAGAWSETYATATIVAVQAEQLPVYDDICPF